MRLNRTFVIGVLAFLAFVFMLEYRMPKKFRWTPTFSHRDKQPFGCYVFDSILKASIPQGYQVVRKTFYQLKEDTTPKAVLMVADEVRLSKTDVAAILKMAGGGSHILVASERLGLLADTLHIADNYHYISMSITEYARSGQERDTLVWQQDSIYTEHTCTVYPQLLQRTISGPIDSLGYQVLCRAKKYGHAPVALRIPIGKGSITWASTPLLFTNYGILDHDNYIYLFRLLSQLGGLPVVRTEAYTPTDRESPLRYILSQQPLRWALYLTLTTIALFIFFTARRRQRAIPPVSKPENMSLAFAKQIGTLYAERKNYADAVIKKYTYFAEELRNALHIDITDAAADRRNLRRIASQTGMEEQQIAALIDELRLTVSGGRQITAADMCRYIKAMDEIILHSIEEYGRNNVY